MRSHKKYKYKNRNKIVYTDHNATTLMCSSAKKILNKYASCYNPSSGNKQSLILKNHLDLAKQYVLNHHNVTKDTHTVIFNSGATEGNCFVIRSVAKAYYKKHNIKPHIICSSYEHKAVLECIEDINYLEYTYVNPDIYGNIHVDKIKQKIKPNTCLISIMAANNELPVMNDIKTIGLLAKENNIPFHSDVTQIYGKYKIDLKDLPIDFINFSAHKFYGPKGVGGLIINKNVIKNLNLTAEITGSQQDHLRGGTEHVSGYLSMVEAIKDTFNNRSKKNKKLKDLKNYTIELLKLNGFHFADYKNYVIENEGGLSSPANKESVKKLPIELVELGPITEQNKLPNTILLSICKNTCKDFCNVQLKKFLDDNNVIVSIGSACQTTNPKASHVLNSISAPPVVKRGVLRISFGDKNNYTDVERLVEVLTEGINQQCNDL